MAHNEADDENLDDLDDVLEQFNRPVAVSTTEATSSSSKPVNRSSTEDEGEQGKEQDELDAAFLEQLNQNMATLLSGLDPATALDGPAATVDGAQPPPLSDLETGEFKSFVEQMLRSSAEGSALTEQDLQEALKEMDERLKGDSLGKTPDFSNLSTKPVASSSKPKTFQDTLKQTQDKLRQTDANARAQMEATANTPPTDDDGLAALLAQFSKSGMTDDASLQEALEGMMSQLMSKDLLYEPIKDLCNEYPTYLAKYARSLPDEDLKRYRKQQEIVNQLAAKFEDPKYSDDNEERRQEVVDLMQQMQNCGAPPKDMMGGLPAGLNMGADGLPSFLEGKDGNPECPQS